MSKIDEEIDNQVSNVPPKKEKLKKMWNLRNWKLNQLVEGPAVEVVIKFVFSFNYAFNYVNFIQLYDILQTSNEYNARWCLDA